jgi:hypothetical protein
VSRTGRYRIFPIVGTSVMTLACLSIGAIGLGRWTLFDVLATTALGLSFGFQLSPMTVTIQNALEWRDTGIGMSCLMFFRLMGGAFGVALLSSVLIGALDAGARAIPGHEILGPQPGIALFHLHEQSGQLTPALLAALSSTMAGAFRRLFLVAAVFGFLALLGACALREVPLRGRPER